VQLHKNLFKDQNLKAVL